MRVVVVTKRESIMEYSLSILLAMGRLNKHVYGGTVPFAVKQKRRVKNRIARKQNRLNRQ